MAEKLTESSASTVREGYLPDYLTGDERPETAKELVRQRVERSLVQEFRIAPEDIGADFQISVLNDDGKARKRRLDLVVFESGMSHQPGNVRRVVIIKAPPAGARRGTAKLREHEQAEADLRELKEAMAALDGCQYGLWTNDHEQFCLRRQQTRFETRFDPIGYWPQADETFSMQETASTARLRSADADALKATFRRCHNFIHGNEGMPKDAAFWQFLSLITAKMHDERVHRGDAVQFFAGPHERFTVEGQRNIRARVLPLFEKVKEAYPDVFRPGDEITLSDRALAFLVSELSRYDFTRSAVDAKGAAYQELVGSNLRGDRGQYFTPRTVVDMAVRILDPRPDERVLDPSCGTGGFLVSTIAHQLERFRREDGLDPATESTADFLDVSERLRDYADRCVFGADFDPFLVRAARMNVMMASSGSDGHIFHLDSLVFPGGHLSGVSEANRRVPLGSIDVLLSNPPFGTDIPITDPVLLQRYDLAIGVEKTDDGVIRPSGRYLTSVSPEILFVEQIIRWVKPGGRMAIVLPNGLLSNPGDSSVGIRAWILRHCWVLASVEIPIEAFIVEAGVNILTSVLFLKRKTEAEMAEEALLDAPIEYPVFMAVAEKAGVDRRGKTLYKRSPDGEEIVKDVVEHERVRTREGVKTLTLRRKKKTVDEDFTSIVEAYHAFRDRHGEPGVAKDQ